MIVKVDRRPPPPISVPLLHKTEISQILTTKVKRMSSCFNVYHTNDPFENGDNEGIRTLTVEQLQGLNVSSMANRMRPYIDVHPTHHPLENVDYKGKGTLKARQL